MTHRMFFLHGDRTYRLSPGPYPIVRTDDPDFPEVGSEGILTSSIDDGEEVRTKVRITKNLKGVVSWMET